MSIATPLPSLFPTAPLRELVFPFPQQSLALLVPQDPFTLMEATNDPDETPNEIYWAEAWPAGVALAAAILTGEVRMPDGPEPVLELGCGTGLSALAAAVMLGRQKPPGKILASDIEIRALELVAENARRNNVSAYVETVRLNWRTSKDYVGRHRLILVADGLYDPEAGGELARFLFGALHPAPESRALVVDTDRWSARHFGETAEETGFRVVRHRRMVPFTSCDEKCMEMPRSGPPTDAELFEKKGMEATFFELRRVVSNSR